jgi:hypothetical protein
MFAFTGPAIDRNIMNEKIKSVETGLMGAGNLRYASMLMFPNFLRRESCLLNILKEYNRLAGSNAITVVKLDGLPAVVPLKRFPNNAIEIKLKHDRVAKTGEFDAWKNVDRETMNFIKTLPTGA